jgi:DNA polymerase-3 subunit delta'
MAWDQVIGQDRAVQALRAAVAGGRVAQAYLFHGPEGTGKRAAAIALGQALLCEQRSAGDDSGCGTCGACRRVAKLGHPDLHVLFPRPRDAEPADIAARLALLAENPYTAVDYRRRASLDGKRATNRQAIYSLALVDKEVRRSLSLHPVEGRATVAVITDAEAMRDEAANAFLKLLEEPRPHVTLVLTAERPDQLLPTVLSRCQRLRFDPLPPEEIERALIEREGISPSRAALAARLADGSYTRARTVLEGEDLQELRDRALDLARKAFMLRPTEMPGVIEAAAGLGREPLKGLLAQLHGWIRDLNLARTLGADAPLVNVDQAESIHRFLERAPSARLDRMAKFVEEASELLERNAHSALLLSTLAHALNDAMHGRPRESLHAPLTG